MPGPDGSHPGRRWVGAHARTQLPLLLPPLAGWPPAHKAPAPRTPHTPHYNHAPTTPALPAPASSGPAPHPLALALCLAPADPAKRIGIKEIQDHPWYMKDLPPGVKEMNDNMRMPPAGSQVRACVRACVQQGWGGLGVWCGVWVQVWCGVARAPGRVCGGAQVGCAASPAGGCPAWPHPTAP